MLLPNIYYTTISLESSLIGHERKKNSTRQLYHSQRPGSLYAKSFRRKKVVVTGLIFQLLPEGEK